MTSPSGKRIEIHVIAGLGGFFTARGTKALDQIFDDISPVWDATHWYHGSWEKCSNGIIHRVKRYKDKPIIILVGHSYGALRNQQIAVKLKEEGIGVAYIAGIDPTALPFRHPPMRIPTNVEYVDEFWSTRGLFNMPLRVRKRKPDGSRGGKYTYSSRTAHKTQEVRGGHIPCASADQTRKTILNKVLELIQ